MDSAIAIGREIAQNRSAGMALRLSVQGTLIQWGQAAAARPMCEALVQDEPDEAEAFLNLGSACLQVRDYPAAREALDRTILLDRSSALAWNNLGRLLLNEGERDSAIAALRESHRLDPDDVQVLVLLAETLQEKGHAEEAYAFVREAVRLAPGLKEARELRYRLEQEYPELVKAPEPARRG